MIEKISFTGLIKQYNNQIAKQKINFTSNPQKALCKDTIEINSNKKEIEISPEIMEILDNTKFEFEKYNGEIYEGTLRQYLKDQIINERRTSDIQDIIHCTQYADVADKIVKEGLDWTKTSRMQCGPGTYFCNSTAEGEFYGAGRNYVYATYTGKQDTYPIFAPRFYDAIDSNQELIDKIQLASGKSAHVANKIINKYCHDILQNEMGVDILYAGTGRAGGAYVVINDNCVKLRRTI